MAQKATRGGQGRPTTYPTTPAPVTPIVQPEQKHGLDAATAVLPLRLFLAVSFLAAGWDKLSDPQFFDSTASGYIGAQLSGYANSSPLGGFLTSVAVPNATLFGAMVLVGELAIGLGTLVGLFSRTAAFFGLILSLTLWLTASWQVSPFFLGSDLPYAMGWLILVIAGAHPVYSLDGQWQKWRLQHGLTLWGRPVASDTAGAADSGTNHPLPVATAIPSQLIARRRFITVAGATVFAGAVTGLAWAKTLHDKSEGGVAPIEAANPTTDASSTTSAANTTTSVTNTTTSVANTVNPVTAGNTGPTAAVPQTSVASVAGATEPATTVTVAANATTAAPATTVASATTAAPAIKGTVLAKLSSIATGNAQKFTVPGTRQGGIIIHEKDGSVKAFSTVCTHEGCEVDYYPSYQVLACPCHGAEYDITNGSVVRGPARRALASYNVQVDSSGNIVYVHG